MYSTKQRVAALVLCGVSFYSAAGDTTPQQQLQRWETQAGVPASAVRGEVFFATKRLHGWSCATCHHAPPKRAGAHIKTKKTLRALAPAFNERSLTQQRKADKWFRRNCNDVVGRACSAQEKADVIAYLLSVN